MGSRARIFKFLKWHRQNRLTKLNIQCLWWEKGFHKSILKIELPTKHWLCSMSSSCSFKRLDAILSDSLPARWKGTTTSSNKCVRIWESAKKRSEKTFSPRSCKKTSKSDSSSTVFVKDGKKLSDQTIKPLMTNRAFEIIIHSLTQTKRQYAAAVFSPPAQVRRKQIRQKTLPRQSVASYSESCLFEIAI